MLEEAEVEAVVEKDKDVLAGLGVESCLVELNGSVMGVDSFCWEEVDGRGAAEGVASGAVVAAGGKGCVSARPTGCWGLGEVAVALLEATPR